MLCQRVSSRYAIGQARILIDCNASIDGEISIAVNVNVIVDIYDSLSVNFSVRLNIDVKFQNINVNINVAVNVAVGVPAMGLLLLGKRVMMIRVRGSLSLSFT